MKHLSYLNKYLYKYRKSLIPGVLFVIISNAFGVLPATVIRLAFNLVTENIGLYRLFDGFDRQDIVYKIFGYSLILFGSLVIMLAVLRGIFLFFMRQTIILVSRRIEYDLKNEIYNHYQNLSLAFYRRNNTGDLMNRATEDVSRVRMYLGPAIMYAINTAVLFVMVIYAMFRVNAQLALYSLLPLPLLAVTIYLVENVINKKSERIQERLSILSGFVQETFAGVRVIKAYVREEQMKSRFAKESEAYRVDSMGLARIQAMFFPVMMLLIGLSTIITVYVGGIGVMKGTVTPGNIAEFIFYVNQLGFPFMALGWVVSLVQRAAASQKRINEFLNTQPEIKGVEPAKYPLKGHIEFKNVSFTHPETGIKALQNITLKIEPGEFVAVIGHTGSGKSTLANLLMRMYDVSSGEILVDGNNIKQINLGHYRSQVGFVPQEVFLFSDTLSDNIAFGADFTDKNRVEQAAKDSAVYENIIAFDKGFDTMIGERGITLSGGQKQRVSIARAIYNNPQLIIFDDCLSAVDTKTEEEILSNLGKVMQGKTSVMIAHRISTIKNADKIFVMQNGGIAEEGNHQTLLDKKGLYHELYEKQLLEEEMQVEDGGLQN